MIKEKEFTPFGEEVHAYSSKEKSFSVYRSTLCTPGFTDYYRKLQVFLLFYIDGAEFLSEEEIENPYWEYYVTYEKLSNGCYSLAGFFTVYNFYQDLNRYRKRIS